MAVYAIPATETIRQVFGPHARAARMTRDDFRERSEGTTHLRRLPTLAQPADVAAFVAADVTGTAVNLGGGAIAG